MFCRCWTHARSHRRYATTRHACSHRAARPKDGGAGAPCKPLVWDWARVENRAPAEARGRQKSTKSTRHRIRAVAAYDRTIVFTRQCMRSLEVLCGKSAAIRTRSLCGCLVFQMNEVPVPGGLWSIFVSVFHFQISIREVHKNPRNSAMQPQSAISCVPSASDSLLPLETNTRLMISTSLTKLRQRLGGRDCQGCRNGSGLRLATN